jgi:TolB-like protein/Flp pilus assembly protein TadD
LDKPFRAYKGNDPYVFVCYAHDNATTVYSDLERLHEQGVNLWYDEGISAGRAWRAEVAEAVQGAAKLLYFISEASSRSSHCIREVGYALDNDLEIVPVYLDETKLPAELDLVLNRVQALYRSRDEMYSQHLLDALNSSNESRRPFSTRPGKRRGIPLSTLGVITVALVAVVWWYLQDYVVSNDNINPNSIAVLPLLNIDGGERTAIFSNGLTEDVINSLSRIRGLQVSSRRDSFSLPANVSSAEVRQRLRVSYYIEGSVRLLDDNIRVIISLIESGSGRQLQSRSFDRRSEDLFEIQDEITRLAVANLRVALPDDTQIVIGSAHSVTSIDAYVLYRRGIEELQKPMTVETIEQALDWFEQSLEVDPDYAATHAGKCSTYASGFNFVNDPLFIGKAEQACAAALALDPNLIVVHNALGDLYRKTGKYQEAESSYLRTLAIDQNDTSALDGLAWSYSSQQRLADAEEKFRQAIASQPGNWRSFNSLGTFYYQNGRFGEATEAFKEVVSLDTENMQGWSNIGSSLMLSGNFADAAPAFERSISIDPQAGTYSNLGLMYYYLGMDEDAVAALENATKLAPNSHLVWANLGDALSVSGQAAKADQAFGKAEGFAEKQLAINLKDAETLIDLAWIKAMLGKTAEAEELVVRAQSIMPSDPQVHFIHGLILTRLGEYAAAAGELEQAVELGYPLTMLFGEPHLRDLEESPELSALMNKLSAD